jgi:hypothetical protein
VRSLAGPLALAHHTHVRVSRTSPSTCNDCVMLSSRRRPPPPTSRTRRRPRVHTSPSTGGFAPSSTFRRSSRCPHLPSHIFLRARAHTHTRMRKMSKSRMRSRTHAQLRRLSPPPHSSSSGFRDFLLKPEILRAIVDCGFEHPSQGETQLCPAPSSRIVAALRHSRCPFARVSSLSLDTAAVHRVSSVDVWFALVVSMQC